MNDTSSARIISSQDFLKVFGLRWEELLSRMEQRAVFGAYEDGSQWTAWMLGDANEKKVPVDLAEWMGKKGLLGLCGQDLRFEPKQIRKEENRIDMMFVNGVSLFGGNENDPHWGYASHLAVVIEHENKINLIQEEMWKLLFWRAPLKVIVTYDRPGLEPSKRCREQLKRLLDMRNKVDACYSAKDNSEYLILVGRQDRSDGLPSWTWTTDFQTLQPLTV